jgi:hypothetical protein
LPIALGALSALAALVPLTPALMSRASAQTAEPRLFQPSLTDPQNPQRFSRPPEAVTRSMASGDPPAASAGVTGFDSTGSISRKKKAKLKPGAKAPAKPAASETRYGAPQQVTGQTAAQQIAVRNVYANAYRPPDAPQRRALVPFLDPYEPIGVRVGEFLLRPAIEITRGLDTNAARTSNAARSAFTLVAPELQARSEWSRHELGASLRGSYASYDSLSSINQPTADTRVFGRIDATRDTRYEFEGRFLLGTDNPGSPNLQAGLAKLPIYTAWGGTAGVAQRFNRLDLSAKGSVDRFTYRDSELVDGSTVSNGYRNYYQYRVQLRASYEFKPGIKPFVEIDADKRIHDASCECDAIVRDSQALTPRVGVTFELARHLTGEVSVGYLTRRYQDARLLQLSGAVADASLVWAATGLTTATLTANSRAEETILTGVSGALRRDVGLQIDHAFRRWLIGTVKVGYGFDQYVGLDREDKRLSLGAALTYKFNRELSLKGEFRQDWRRSNATGVDYNASMFLLGMRLQR